MSTRDNGRITSVMGEECSNGKTDQFTRATGKTTLPVVREGSSMQTETSLSDSGLPTEHREKVTINRCRYLRIIMRS